MPRDITAVRERHRELEQLALSLKSQIWSGRERLVLIRQRSQTATGIELQELDEAARALRSRLKACRRRLRGVRQQQAEVLGIEVETIKSQSPGGHSDTTTQQADTRTR